MMHIDEMGIWNVGTGETTSFTTIAHSIAKKYNAKVEPIPMPENLIGQYQKYTCSDNTKLLKTIGKFKFTKRGMDRNMERLEGKVDKGWGFQLTWATNDLYCGKMMVFTKKGNKFSMHFQRKKTRVGL